MLKKKLYKTWKQRKPRKKKKKRSQISLRKLERVWILIMALGALLILMSLSSCAYSGPKSCSLLDDVRVCRYLTTVGKIFCVKKNDPENLKYQEVIEPREFYINRQPVMVSASDYASIENCRKDAISWSHNHCKQ